MLFLTMNAPPTEAELYLKKGVAGGWQSKPGTAIMIVSPDVGLLRIAGADAESFFELRCLAERDELRCRGGGALLSGAGFIYESTFAMQPDGSMIEKWTAHDAAAQKHGEDVWVRYDPQSASR